MWANELLRGRGLVPPLTQTAYRISPWSYDVQAVAGRLGRAINAMTSAVDHVLCLVRGTPMDAPRVAVRAQDIHVAELVKPLLLAGRQDILVSV
jgi:hypothetical protein